MGTSPAAGSLQPLVNGGARWYLADSDPRSRSSSALRQWEPPDGQKQSAKREQGARWKQSGQRRAKTFLDKSNPPSTEPIGSRKRRENYYPFGLRMPGRTSQESPQETEEDFTGHVKDNSTGLHYAGARYYSAAFGRWTTTEPLLHSKGPKGFLKQDPRLLWMSPYNYTYGNPVTLRDPDGRCPNCVPGAIGAVAGGVIEGGISVVKQVNKGRSFSEGAKRVAIDAGGGAVKGGAIGASFGLGSAALAGGGSGAVVKPVKQLLKGEDVSAEDFGLGLVSGALEGLGGKGVLKGLSGKSADEIVKTLKEAGSLQKVKGLLEQGAGDLTGAFGGSLTGKVGGGFVQAIKAIATERYKKVQNGEIDQQQQNTEEGSSTNDCERSSEDDGC